MNQDLSSLDLLSNTLKEIKKIGYTYTKDINLNDCKLKFKLTSKELDQAILTPKARSSLDLYEDECKLGSICTLNANLDEALGGGIPLGQITEFCGNPGSGRTQMCFQLCVNVQLPLWCGGVDGEAIYICTNNNFASHRIQEIAQQVVSKYNNIKKVRRSECAGTFLDDCKFTEEDIMKRIHYMFCNNHVKLLASVIYIEHFLQKNPKVRLIIINSISLPLKHVEPIERSHFIYRLFGGLQKLSDKFKFAIVLTNDNTTRVDDTGEVYFKPLLGDSYYHRINIRVELLKISQEKFRANILKNVFGKNTSFEYKIT